MALGDLRVALEYAVRDEQPPHERLYFVHLAAMHLRELLPLLDPPAGSTLPDLEAFLAATQPPAEDAERLRASHARVLELLTEPFQQRPTVKLRGELRRLRNGFAHYHRDARSEAALTAAMERAADVQSRYVIRTRTMRADYADDVAANLVHPFDGAEADACARAPRPYSGYGSSISVQ